MNDSVNNTTFDLEAFRADRDAKRPLPGWQWKPSAADVIAAYEAGERDFTRANLYSANLYSANLDSANLYSANLYRANLYSANLDSANLSRANLDSANLYRANLDSANLDSANLSRANLYRANLSRANLDSANLINARGLYQAFAPGLSSRRDSLYAHLALVDGEIVLRFTAGCQTNQTAEGLRALVQDTHGNNAHAQQYEAAITFIETCFAVDMAVGRWDYLKDWKQAAAPE